MPFVATPAAQKDWPSLLAAVFRHDLPLLRYYHVKAPCELALAVADSYRALQQHTASDFVLYALRERAEGPVVGMAGVEGNGTCLVTFGLRVAYRTPAGVAALSQTLRNLLTQTQPVSCILYARNHPAQRFLRRMGFVADPAPLQHPENGQAGILFTLTN